MNTQFQRTTNEGKISTAYHTVRETTHHATHYKITHGESVSQFVTENHENLTRSKFSFYFPANVLYFPKTSMTEDVKEV